MDGGGGVLRPLTAGFAGGPGLRADLRPPFLDRPPVFRLPSLRRRRFAAAPLERRLPRFLGTGLALAFFAGCGALGVGLGGQYALFQQEFGEPHHALARAVGLGLDRVSIVGLSQMAEAEVLAAAGITPKTSLAFLDAGEVRRRLEAVPLIKTASVRKIYPRELAVTLTEREPHAVWQRHGELFVVARDGAVIDEMRDGRFASLPQVVGEEANLRIRDYLALLDAAGPLKPRIRAGTLVSGRRWTLKMDNGIEVRLPELGAAAALARLVKLEREQRILDKDVIAIDLRVADRVVVRLTEEAASARYEALKRKPTRGKGVET